MLLRQIDSWRPDMAVKLAEPHPPPLHSGKGYESYGRAEFQRIASAARADLRRAAQRIRGHRALLEQYRSGGLGDPTRRFELLDYVERHADVPRRGGEFPSKSQLTAEWVREGGFGGTREVIWWAHLSPLEVSAGAVLLAVLTGQNPYVIMKCPAGHHRTDGDAGGPKAAIVGMRKPRRRSRADMDVAFAAAPDWISTPDDPTSMSRRDELHTAFEESSKIISVNFKPAPKPLREYAKHYMWVLINTDPPMQLRRTTATRPSLYTVRMCWYPWRIFLNWLHKHRVARFCDVTPEMLDEYLVYLGRSQDGVEPMQRCVVEVRRLWGYRSVLPESMRLPEMPPWGGDAAGVLLGKVRSNMDNLTPRINEDTTQALLLWALRFIEDFADDIIAAHEEFLFLHARGPDVTPGPVQRKPRLPRGGAIKLVTDYTESVRQSRGSLPGRINEAGEREINFPYIARVIGIPRLPRPSYSIAQSVLAASGLPIDDDAYLSTPVTATLDGRPWLPGRFSYDQTRQLVRHLHTAGLIVIAYLSGARPAEILNLRRGCIERDDVNEMYLMSGVYFKNAVDEQGNKVPAGLPRADPWVVVGPAAHAIRVLERLHDEDLLFTNRVDLTRNYVQRRSGGLALNTQVATNGVHRFIDFVDRLCAHHHIDPIPSDPHGQLTISRFRRTLAWFIRRRPRELVAASIQYGHVHTRMIQGYAGAYDSGFPDELAFEDFLARLEQFADDEHALTEGERVSGPASQTYTQRLSAANGKFAGYALTSKKQARDLLANPLLQIYHGEGMTCVFDATKAACQLRGARDDPLVTPDIDDCRPGCRNIARTDRDMATVRLYRDRLAATVADRAAPPLRHQREQRELARIDTIIVEHDAGH